MSADANGDGAMALATAQTEPGEVTAKGQERVTTMLARKASKSKYAGATWVNWRGNDREQTPNARFTTEFRCVVVVMMICQVIHMTARAISLRNLGVLSYLGFVAEFLIQGQIFCVVSNLWRFTDTNGTTPSLDDITDLDAGAGRAPAPFRMSEEQWPTCAILLPTYNEERAVLEPAVEAALEIEYPGMKLQVYVCDDGSIESRREQCPFGEDWVAAMCAEKQAAQTDGRTVTHLRRRKHKGYAHHAKAGNINNVLGLWGHDDRWNCELSKGWPGGSACTTPEDWDGLKDDVEFVAIFDADMMPRMQFLQRSLPFFYNWSADAGRYVLNNVAFVQGPQMFHNIVKGDPLDTAQLFTYDMVSAYDGLGCTNCLGSGWIARRDALMGKPAPGQTASAGMQPPGLQVGSLLEDVITAVSLHMHGWDARYLSEHLQIGTAPPNLYEIFTRTNRLKIGCGQVGSQRIFTKPFLTGNMSLRQKLLWAWPVMMTLFQPLLLLYIMCIPIAVLFIPDSVLVAGTGYPILDTMDQICGIIMGVMMIFWIFLIPDTGVGGAYIPIHTRIITLCTEMFVYLPCSLYALFVFISGYDMPFIVSDKSSVTDVNHGRYHPICRFHYFFIALYTVVWAYCVACAAAAPIHPEGWDMSQMNKYIGCAVFCMVMLFTLKGVVSTLIWPLPGRHPSKEHYLGPPHVIAEARARIIDVERREEERERAARARREEEKARASRRRSTWAAWYRGNGSAPPDVAAAPELTSPYGADSALTGPLMG